MTTPHIILADIDQIYAGLRQGDPDAITRARAILHQLADQSSAHQLSQLLLPVKIITQNEAKK